MPTERNYDKPSFCLSWLVLNLKWGFINYYFLFHRPYTCPCPGASCKWQGSLEQVMPHLMQSHKSITTLQGGCYWKLSIQVLVRVYNIASLLTPQCLYSGDYVLAVLSDVFSVCLWPLLLMSLKVCVCVPDLQFHVDSIAWYWFVSRGGYCVSGHRHQLARCSGLGHDAVLFRSQLHAGFGEAGEDWRPSDVLRYCPAHWNTQTGRELYLQVCILKRWK